MRPIIGNEDNPRWKRYLRTYTPNTASEILLSFNTFSNSSRGHVDEELSMVYGRAVETEERLVSGPAENNTFPI